MNGNRADLPHAEPSSCSSRSITPRHNGRIISDLHDEQQQQHTAGRSATRRPTSPAQQQQQSAPASPPIGINNGGIGSKPSSYSNHHRSPSSRSEGTTTTTSSGLSSILKWFKKSPILTGDRPHSQPPPSSSRIISNTTNTTSTDPSGGGDLSNYSSTSPSLSLSSLSSRSSVYSTATNGFAFIPPEQYAPYGAAFQPEKRIAVGPITDTYRQRLTAHQRSKDANRGRPAFKLSQKYNLLESDSASAGDDLTLTRRRSQFVSSPVSVDHDDQHQPPQRRRPSHHRRTRSDSSKDRRAGAYVHVKGKRKAPAPPTTSIATIHRTPPTTLSPMSTLGRRNKRQAPAPPTAVQSSDNAPAISCSGTTPTTAAATTTAISPLFNDAEIQAIMNGNSAAAVLMMAKATSSSSTTTATTTSSPLSCNDDVPCTDTLRLEHGLLKHTESVSMSPPRSPLPQYSSVSATTSPTHAAANNGTSSAADPLIAPRPWYKRSSLNRDHSIIPFKREVTLKTMEKRKNKSKNGSSANSRSAATAAALDKDDGRLTRDSTGHLSRGSSIFDGLFFGRSSGAAKRDSEASTSTDVLATEKRRSAIGMPNISELDREAGEIIRAEEAATAQRLAASMAALEHDKYFEFPGETATPATTHQQQLQQPTNGNNEEVSSTSAIVPSPLRRSSTRELISRFEETNSNGIRQTVSTAVLVDNNIIGRYFADAGNGSSVITTTTAPTTATSASAINGSTTSPTQRRSSSSSSATPPPLSTNSGVVTAGTTVSSSSSSSSSAVARNSALSPSPPKPVRSQQQRITASVEADAPPTTTTTSSMMQRIFSDSSTTSAAAAAATTEGNNAAAVNVTKNTTTLTTDAVVVSSTSPPALVSSPLLLPISHHNTSTTAASSVVDAQIPATNNTAATTWICSHCTLENYQWRIICEVCERIRPAALHETPEAIVGPDGQLVPVPRFRYAGKSSKTAENDELLAAERKAQPQRGNVLVDSSAVVVASQPEVFVAPYPARHETAAVQQISPNLAEIRAARIEKFSSNGLATTTTTTPSTTTATTTLMAKKPALITDRGSLEREKQRLREMIREMNAKALADKYPVGQTTPPTNHRHSSPIKKTTTPSPVRETSGGRGATDPVPIPVGRGAVRKQPQQPRRLIESPEDKIIADTANFHDSSVVFLDKASAKLNGLTPDASPLAARRPSALLVVLPASIAELPTPTTDDDDDEGAAASSSAGAAAANSCSDPDSPTTQQHQQRLVDEQIDSIYAKLRTNNRRGSSSSGETTTNVAVAPGQHERQIARGLDDFKAVSSAQPQPMRRRTDTIALNRLLKDLELAIGEGEHERAAELAMDLARMKVSLSVTKQHNTPTTTGVDGEKTTTTTATTATADAKISNVVQMTPDEEEGAAALPPSREARMPVGWTCPLCTLINEPERLGCAVCSESRPPTAIKLSKEGVVANVDCGDGVRRRSTDNGNNSLNSNDLNKISANRRSAEIFNIAPRTINNSGATTAKPTTVPDQASAAAVPSPNITRTKYRGVDNYNPHVNKTSPAASTTPAVVVAAQQQLTPVARKSTTPYKSPLARTNGLSGGGGGDVKITAVTLKTGVQIPMVVVPKIPAMSKPEAAPITSSSHYTALLHLDNNCSVVSNTEPFECAICFGRIACGAGCVLRDCLHTFCRECLAQTVRYSDEAVVRCPYMDAAYSCDSSLQEREIRGLLTREAYERHLAQSLRVAEQRAENAFHCRTPGCRGWCIFEDNVNEFRCPICKITNCLTCRVIHDGLNCKQYQDRMNSDSDCNEEARRTSEMLSEMIDKGEAMKCPVCQVILMKKWGCDWLKCSMCKTEICWVTRGIRWGPEGKGDTTAGCRCGVDGVKCHPKCNYCH